MCIETVNKNRKNHDLKEITGEYNITTIESLYPNATLVATYKQFQKMGRQVKKGEKSFKLKGVRKNNKKTDKDDDKISFFKFSVFEYSQTEPLKEKEE